MENNQNEQLEELEERLLDELECRDEFGFCMVHWD